MQIADARASQALDLLLALRDEDLDGWERRAAEGVPECERRQRESLDVAFAALLDRWNEAEAGSPAPEITAALFAGLPQYAEEPAEAPPVLAPARPHRRIPRRHPSSFVAAALAASLAVVVFAIWQLRAPPAPLDGGTPPRVVWKSTGQETAARVALDFSVERDLPTGVVIEPGRRGASYGPADRLVMRYSVSGDGGWLYVLEARDGDARLIWQAPDRVEAGTEILETSPGQAAAWQPEPLGGSATYLVVLATEPLPASALPGLAGAVLAATGRPDLWPRPVLAADSFTVDWEAGEAR